MTIYLTSGKKIRITQSIANNIWELLCTKEGAEAKFIQLDYEESGDTYLILRKDDISYIK